MYNATDGNSRTQIYWRPNILFSSYPAHVIQYIIYSCSHQSTFTVCIFTHITV